MKKFFIGLGIVFLAIIVLFVVFGGFAFFSASKYTPSVEKFVADFYSRYNQRDFSYIFNTMADQKFKSSGTYDNFKKLMNGIHQKFGVAKDRKKGGWRLNYAPDGTYFSVQYEVTHEKGKSTDSFVLRKHNEFWLLIGYHLNSNELF